MDTKFSVALHTLMYISETENIATSELLAKSVNTNSSHIRKIIALLKKAKLIKSHQGKSGFMLAKHTSNITLEDIYKAIYAKKRILNLHGYPNLECPIGTHIKDVLTPVFECAEKSFRKELEQTTLEKLIKELYQIGGKDESSISYTI